MDSGTAAEFEAIGERGRVVVLAGSGISTDQPSGLLTWREFNQAVLDALVGSAASFLPAAAAEIRSLSLDLLPVQAFSSLVAGSFSDAHYLPVLDVLEGDIPNRGHSALASLAQQGVLHAVLTTNFDTLIEQALAIADVDSLTMAADRDYQIAPDGRLGVHKLHGTVGRHDTLVDAVHQKFPGLSATRRAAVREVCGDCDVVVLGFSGADFAFDRDYIPLGTARSVRWVTRPGRPVSERVAGVLDGLADAKVVEEDIVPLLESLGAEPLPASARPTASPPADRRRQVHDRLVGAPDLEWGAAAACLRLASAGGRREIAAAIAAAAEPRLSPVDELPFIASSMARAVTALALREYRLEEAIARADREIAFLECWIDRGENEQLARAHRAGALFNRAQARLGLGEAEAAADLEQARRSSYAAGARELRSPIYSAQAASIADGDPELALSLLMAAEATASGTARAHDLISARSLRSGILVGLGEYDAALAEAERLAELAEITGDHEARLHAEWQRTIVALLRGSPEPDVSALLDALRTAPHMQLPRLASELQRALGWLPQPPEELLAVFAELGVGVGAAIEDEEPTPSRSSREDELRMRLRRAELAGDGALALGCLAALAGEAHLKGIPHRLLDLALGYRCVAEQENDRKALVRALNLCAIGHDLAGDTRSAAALWSEALGLAPAVDVESNLGWALSRLGEDDRALHHLDTAVARSIAIGEIGIELRVRWYRAEHERRYGDATAAETMLTETVARAKEVGDRVGEAKLQEVLEEWQAEVAGQPLQGESAQSARYRPPSPPSAGPALAAQARAQHANGERRAAEETIAEAYRAYEEVGDLTGMSASLNDRAVWRYEDGDIGGAIESAVEALDLRRRVPDLVGEVLTLSNIASWTLLSATDGDGVRAAEEAALEAIAIGRAIEPSGSLLQAFGVLLLALKAQEADEARIEEVVRQGRAAVEAVGTRHAEARLAFERVAEMEATG